MKNTRHLYQLLIIQDTVNKNLSKRKKNIKFSSKFIYIDIVCLIQNPGFPPNCFQNVYKNQSYPTWDRYKSYTFHHTSCNTHILLLTKVTCFTIQPPCTCIRGIKFLFNEQTEKHLEFTNEKYYNHIL